MAGFTRRLFIKRAPLVLSLVPAALLPKALQARLDVAQIDALKEWLTDFAGGHECDSWQLMLTDYGLGRISLSTRRNSENSERFYLREQFIYAVNPTDQSLEKTYDNREVGKARHRTASWERSL